MAESDVRFHGRIIEAVTVDFWATLAHDTTYMERRRVRKEGIARLFGEHGSSATFDQLAAAIDEFSTIWHDTWMKQHRTPTASEAADFLLERYPLPDGAEVRDKLATIIDDSLLEAPPVPVAGALEGLRRLGEHFPLALVCDTGLSGARNINALIAQWGIDDLLKVRIYSEEVGVSKPHPKMFLSAIEGLGVPQQRVVHIGDLDPTDILGAKNLGMAAIRFDGAKEQAACKPCSMADEILTSWEEITTALLPKDEAA